MATSILPIAARAAGLVGSVIDSSTSLLHKQGHDIVRLAMGSPAAEAVPSEILAGIAASELSAPDAYDYAATEGDPPLHAALLEMLRGTSDETTADRLTITAGGMQGLDLFCKIFVDPWRSRHRRVADVHQRQRDGVILRRNPVWRYRSTTTVWTSRRSSVWSARRDARRRRSTRSRRSRTRPASRCRWSGGCDCWSWPGEWGSMVIDDDPYGLLRFDGEPLPTLRELGGGDPLVFAVRTFSKIVAPGLRVGWVDTVPELQPLLINAKQAMDTCTNLPAQRLLTGFLTGGHLDDHLTTQRAEYKRRKEAMHAALREHFGDSADVDRPGGGLLLLVSARQRRCHSAFRAGACRRCGLHSRHGVLAVRAVRKRAAAVLRLHAARPDP